MTNNFRTPVTTLAIALVSAFTILISLVACVDADDPHIAEADPPEDPSGESSPPAEPAPAGEDGAEEVNTTSGSLTVCHGDGDCASDEACTQGGHCVNITGDRDATEAIQADLDNLDPAVGIGTPYRLPTNAHLLLNDLNGDGIALTISDKIIFDGGGSLLEVENDVTGMQLTQDAEWSLVRDLRFDPQTPQSEHDGIAIDVRAHGVRLDNILFWRMGTGVRAHTTVDGEFANVNSQQWSRLVFRGVHNKATDLAGGDANAGVMLGLEVIGSAGIKDNSFLGNTYIGPTMEGTHTRSMDLESNAARNAVFGAYVELGDPDPTSASMHDLFVGGNAIDRLHGPGDRIGNLAARLRFESPGEGTGTQVRIPGHDDSPIGWRHPEEDEWWYLRYFDHPSMLGWGIAYQNSGTVPFFWTGGDHPDGPAHLEFDETAP